MYDLKKNLLIVSIYFVFTIGSFFYFYYKVNIGPDQAMRFKTKQIFLRYVHLSSPAVITGGRNIAFETGSAVSNAPASYLNLFNFRDS